MLNPIVIFGVGGFGREVLALLLDLNRDRPSYDVRGFLDGNAGLHGSLVHGLPVLGGAEWAENNPGTNVAIALGSPATKRRVRESLQQADVQFPTLVSPRAWIGPNVELGEGTIICAYTVVTTDIVIRDFVTLNLTVTIGHDSTLDDYVTLAPGTNVSGYVHLGEGVEVGTNVGFVPGVEVGEWSIVGAGALVAKSLPSNVTAVGTPAKPIKERDPGWHLA